MSEQKKECIAGAVMGTVSTLLVGFLVYCLASPFASYSWTF